MLQRMLKLGLLASFSLAYLEWGKGQHITIGLFQWGFFTGEFAFWQNVTHPLILAGLLGQLMLLLSAFVKTRNWLVYSSIAMLGSVIFLISLAGALSKSTLMMVSVVPFWLCLMAFVWTAFKSK